MSRTLLLLIAAVVVLGLAVALMYLNPPGEQNKHQNQIEHPTPPTQTQEPPKPETPKEIKDQINKNKPSEQKPEEPKAQNPETSKEVPPSTEYSQQIEIVKIETFPADKLIALDGRLSLVASVKNPTNSALAGQTVALLLDGKPFQRRSIDLSPGETQSVYFAIEGIKPAGTHEVQINQQKISVSAFDASSAPQRPNSFIPSDPKFVGATQGLTALGLPGGNLIIPITNGPRTLNPVIATDTDTIEITRQLNGFLIELNPLTQKPEPGLASSWEFSSDYKELKLFLRKGVKFSDGTEFTADDVVFTFSDVLFNSDISARESAALKIGGSYVTVEKLDTYVVQLRLPLPFRPILHGLSGIAILPKHKLSDKIAKLQPGAHGYWMGAKSLIEQNRDQLKELSADPLSQLDQAVASLESPISKKDPAGVEKTARPAIQILDALKNSAKANDLQIVLERVKSYLTQTIDTAQRGQYEGVSPLLFDETWSVEEAREHPEHLTGLGPYVFKRYDPQRRVVLERNLAYWKLDEKGLQLPYIDHLYLDVTPAANTAFQRFQDSQLDIYTARAQDWAKLQTDAMTKKWTLLDKNTKNEPQLVSDTEFLAFNFDTQDDELKKLFQDLRFRRAIDDATDRQTMATQIYHGLAANYSGDEALNLDKAKALLDELGLKDSNSDGIRERSDGKPLGFSILVNKENEARVQVAQLLVETLKQIGIQATVPSLEFDALVSALFSGQFQAALVGLTTSSDFYFNSNVWKSNGSLHFWHRSAQTEPFDWETAIDKLFEESSKTLDENVTAQFDIEIRKLESENLPVIFTVVPHYLVAFRQSIANAENIKPQGEIWALTDLVWWRDENRRFQQ